MPFTNNPEFTRFTEAGTLAHFSVFYEPARHALWIFMHPQPRPCMSAEMMAEYRVIGEAMRASMRASSRRIDFWVMGSAVPGTFNLGGDLALLLSKVQRQERKELEDYARVAVDLMHDMLARFGTEVVSIALIEGTALGGGLELALTHDYILAQKEAKLGFPEMAFNMFPGVGGYSLTARKTSRRFAEAIISDGTVKSAESFVESGLVDQVFDAGNGIATAQALIDRLRLRLTTTRCLLKARARAFPLPYDEIFGIAQDWVDAAFTLEEKDVAMMEYLVQLQNKKVAASLSLAKAA